MGLADRFSTIEATPATSADVTCPRYDPVPGTRRCKHYLKGGACGLPDEFMCVEWLKANGHHVPPPLPLSTATSSTTPVVAENPPATPREEPRVPRDLFGRPLPPPEPAPRSPTKVDRDTPARGLPAADVPVFRNLSDEDIASFKALRVEVCLATEACGEVWLVPEYTGNAGRKELSVKDAATLAAICTAFPGARVTSFEKTDKATPDPSP